MHMPRFIAYFFKPSINRVIEDAIDLNTREMLTYQAHAEHFQGLAASRQRSIARLKQQLKGEALATDSGTAVNLRAVN